MELVNALAALQLEVEHRRRLEAQLRPWKRNVSDSGGICTMTFLNAALIELAERVPKEVEFN
jgi:hypothetical protein